MKIKGAFNVITTPKVRASVEFYTRYFYFETIADLGWYVHLRHPSGAEIAFMEPDHPTQPPIYQSGWTGQGLILSFEVEDAAAAHESLMAEGIEIEFELTDEDWGQRHFGVRDPNGIPVDVVEHSATG